MKQRVLSHDCWRGVDDNDFWVLVVAFCGVYGIFVSALISRTNSLSQPLRFVRAGEGDVTSEKRELVRWCVGSFVRNSFGCGEGVSASPPMAGPAKY